MLNVSFYRFSKKRNSTARPGTPLASLACVLKEPTGVISPELFVSGADSLAGQANYAYIPDFQRYYYVREWTYTEGAWSVSLSVDALATYKTQIGGSTQYVTRAQSAYNSRLIDDMIPTLSVPTVIGTRFASGTGTVYAMGDPFPSSTTTGGRYVVGIINRDTSAVGSTSYYQMDDTQFRAFKGVLMDVGSYTLDTAQQDILKAQFNPINYISSVKWFPNEIPRSSTPLNSLPFGWWTLTGTFNAFRITGEPYRAVGYLDSTAISTADGYTVGIPHHPQAGAVHFSVANEKFCNYSLVFKPFGIYPLPADIVANATTLSLTVSVDPMSGMGAFRLYAVMPSGSHVADYVELATGSTKIAIDIPMAQISRDYLSMASSAIDVAGGLAQGTVAAATLGLGGDIGGFATAAKAGINMIAAAVPQVRATGSMGSLAEYYLPTIPWLKAEFYVTGQEAPASQGYPLCENRQISGLSGFIMCGNVEIDLPATEAEHDMVVSAMEGGFEYE